MFLLLTNIEILATIVFFHHKSFLFQNNLLSKDFFDSNDAICLAKSNIILELKEKTMQVRKLFKGGNYMRKYGMSLKPKNCKIVTYSLFRHQCHYKYWVNVDFAAVLGKFVFLE